jgi:hypothetical protein
MDLDRTLTLAVRVLWTVVFLSLAGLAYQYASAPDYGPPGSVRGSLLGPNR